MTVKVVNGIPYIMPLYDESIYYASGLSSGSVITLPNSGTYKDSGAKDLLVIINDRVVESVRDFTVPVGAVKTSITSIYDLPIDTVVRFIKR